MLIFKLSLKYKDSAASLIISKDIQSMDRTVQKLLETFCCSYCWSVIADYW